MGVTGGFMKIVLLSLFIAVTVYAKPYTLSDLKELSIDFPCVKESKQFKVMDSTDKVRLRQIQIQDSINKRQQQVVDSIKHTIMDSMALQQTKDSTEKALKFRAVIDSIHLFQEFRGNYVRDSIFQERLDREIFWYKEIKKKEKQRKDKIIKWTIRLCPVVVIVAAAFLIGSR